MVCHLQTMNTFRKGWVFITKASLQSKANGKIIVIPFCQWSFNDRRKMCLQKGNQKLLRQPMCDQLHEFSRCNSTFTNLTFSEKDCSQNNRGHVDLKKDARNIFRSAVNSVRPQKMIKEALQYDKNSLKLMVNGKEYNLHRNVFVVGFGKATLGMARAVEDILGEHIVKGIISIPRGLPMEMAEDHQL